MLIEPGKQLDLPQDPIIDAPPEIDQRDSQIAELQEQLAEEKDQRKQDWVICYLVSILVLDMVLAVHGMTVSATILLGIIEIVLLLVLAKRCGVEVVVICIDKMLDIIKKWVGASTS